MRIDDIGLQIITNSTFELFYFCNLMGIREPLINSYFSNALIVGSEVLRGRQLRLNNFQYLDAKLK